MPSIYEIGDLAKVLKMITTKPASGIIQGFTTDLWGGSLPARMLKTDLRAARLEYLDGLRDSIMPAVADAGLNLLYLVPTLQAALWGAELNTFWMVASRGWTTKSPVSGKSVDFIVDNSQLAQQIRGSATQALRNWYRTFVEHNLLLSSKDRDRISRAITSALGSPVSDKDIAVTKQGVLAAVTAENPAARILIQLPSHAFGEVEQFEGVIGTGDGIKTKFAPRVSVGTQTVGAWLTLPSLRQASLLESMMTPHEARAELFKVTVAGKPAELGKDYTVDGGQIVFKTPPAAGQVVWMSGDYVVSRFQLDVLEYAPFYLGGGIAMPSEAREKVIFPLTVQTASGEYKIQEGPTKRFRLDGSPVYAYVSHEHKTIYLDSAGLTEQFAAKAWATPKVAGVLPLAKDAFSTPLEWIEFNLRHELAHITLGRSPGETDAAYENRMNQVALSQMGTGKLFLETGISTRLWSEVEKELARNGKTFALLAPDQRTALITAVSGLQTAYDLQAVLAWVEEDIKLKPAIAYTMFPILPFGAKILSPFFPDEPQVRLADFTSQSLVPALSEVVRAVSAKDFSSTYPSVQSIPDWISAAIRMMDVEMDDLKTRLRLAGLKEDEVEAFSRVSRIYTIDACTKFIVASTASPSYKTEELFIDALAHYFKRSLADAVERSVRSRSQLKVVAEFVDQALATVAPFRPSSLLYKPAATESQEAISEYWDRTVRPKLKEELSAALRGKNLQQLPGASVATVKILGLVEQSLEHTGASTLMWRDQATHFKDTAPRTSPANYVEDILQKLDIMVRNITSVLGTSPKIWNNKSHFIQDGRLVVDQLAFSTRQSIAGTVALPSPTKSDIATLVEVAFVIPFLDESFPAWVNDPSRALERATNRVLDLIESYPNTRQIAATMRDPRTSVRDLPDLAKSLIEAMGKTALFKEELRKTLSAPSPIIQEPVIKKDPALETWTGYTMAAIAGHDPTLVWAIPTDQAVDDGWKAIRNWLGPILQTQYGVSDTDSVEFLEYYKPLLQASITSSVQLVRTGRETFWDPTGTKHIETPIDVHRPYGALIYKKPDQLMYPQEAAVVAAFASWQLLDLFRKLAEAFFGKAGVELPVAASPGVFTEQEAIAGLRANAEMAKVSALGLISPAYPLAERIRAIGAIGSHIEALFEQQLRLLRDQLKRDPSVERIQPYLDSTRTLFDAAANEASKSWQLIPANPITLYQAPAGPVPSLYKVPDMPERFRMEVLTPQAIEGAITKVLDRWESHARDSTIYGRRGQDYAVVFNTVDWTTLYPVPPGQEKLYEEVYNSAIKEFLANKESFLRPLVRTIFYQVPLLSEMDAEAVSYTCMRLLTNEWEAFIMTKLGALSGSIKFQAINFMNPLIADRLYNEAVASLLSSTGVITTEQASLGELQGAGIGQLFRGEALSVWRAMWREHLPKTTLSEAQYTQWLADLIGKFTKVVRDISKTYRDSENTTTGVALSHYAELIDNPDIPVVVKLEWVSIAEQFPRNPHAQVVLAASPQLMYKAGLSVSPLTVFSLIEQFKGKWENMQKGLLGSPKAITSIPLREFSWDYMERIYASTVYPIERAGLRDLIPHNLIQWFDLIKFVWENKLVFPTDSTQFEPVHQGFRMAITAALDNPNYVAFARMWPGVRDSLDTYIPFSLRGISSQASLVFTSRLASKAVNSVYTDALGIAYTFDEAKARANYDWMVKLLQRGEIRRFDALWEQNWVPFIEHDRRLEQWASSYFKEYGDKLQAMRKLILEPPKPGQIGWYNPLTLDYLPPSKEERKDSTGGGRSW